ncbi:MAG: carbohydrate-binding family 9-like protein [Pyrinomonadaceae bacterium]
MSSENVVEARRAGVDLSVAAFDHEAWARAPAVKLTRYWSGEAAPGGRHAETRLLWNERALYARFVCAQREPLIAHARPQLERKTIGLWERDVCELFVAPRADEPERYYEFEVAPTGEWLDLAIRKTAHARETDWNYRSGLRAAARVSPDSITLALCVPWEAFGHVAQTGERWRVNLFRCVGAGATRGYLAWQPTLAPEPDFHVPEKFGDLVFRD